MGEGGKEKGEGRVTLMMTFCFERNEDTDFLEKPN
jgi:hypothetical protein